MNLSKEHHYKLTTTLNANKGSGTSHVSAYDRSHTVSIDNKPDMHLTTDNPKFGDKGKHNPEDLLVSALSSCHMLSFLYLCALEGIIVVDYTDSVIGTMVEDADGGGHFTKVTLNPVFTITDPTREERAMALHHKANEICYIANSVNFEVRHSPVCKVK